MSSATRPPRNARVARPHLPKDSSTPGSWIVETGGGSGGGGGTGVPAPPVTIDPPVEVIFRSDHRVEVDVEWIKNALANDQNFLGVAVYLEDPDISSGKNEPMDGTAMPLDGTAQMSGKWAPVLVNESTKSPAVIFLDSTMGTTFGQTYKDGRDIRIYLAAYGPYSHPHLVRATDTAETPTPNVLVNIPKGRGQGESGQEYAFLVTNVTVNVTTDYNRLVPKYYLTLGYTPPDPAVPVPPGMNHFGGCRIVFVQEDDGGNPIFPGADTGMNIPVSQSAAGFKSDLYEPGAKASKFRVYFVSEDDAQPLGIHINSLVEGTTPFAYADVPAVPPTPDVTAFTISGQKTTWFNDGSRVAHADFSWHLPDVANNIRYAGVFLYLVNVTGTQTPLSTFPKDLTGPQSNRAADYPLDIANVPGQPETWTIAAISYDLNGILADDPKLFGKAGFHSPTVQWVIGPPTPGSAGSGQEYAPLVTIPGNATVAASQSLSADGVGMVSFQVGPWTNPDDNKFGNAQVAMVVNHDPTKPTMWSVPANASTFQTPAIPSFGNIGSPVAVEFYILSDDPQGNKNSLQASVTPKIGYTYTPAAGAIIPARSGWFDESQFDWVEGEGLTATRIEARNVYVGKTLVVGGAPDTSFAGQFSGQIAVKNSSGQLRAWMGEQQPDQGQSGQPLYGGWFGQIWVGGTNPLDAPLWVDNQGIVQVGGIAARQGSRYPYLSIRDQTGLEMGRIGAAINVNSGSVGDNTGPQPPAQLTAGAWFTQLAVGGNNLSNWNVLITPDTSKPLGSLFQMRNIFLLSIDYAAQALQQPYNNQYRLEFGSSAWVTTGGSQWQFPGIKLSELDAGGLSAVFLNRGLVLRGTVSQNSTPLVSLVTFQGDSAGRDSAADKFWGELAMYSPLAPWGRTVYLASGAQNIGNPSFLMQDVNANLLFRVNTSGDVAVSGVLQGAPSGGGATTPVNAFAYNVSGYGPVIDSTGAWKGKPIATASSQTPWAQPINGNQQPLTNAGSISAAQYSVNSGAVVVDQNGVFRGPGVDVGVGNHVYASYIATNQYGAGPNKIETGTLNVANDATVTGTVNAGAGFGGGMFRGSGVDVGPNNHVYAGYIATNQYGGGYNQIDTGTLHAQNVADVYTLRVNGQLVCNFNSNNWLGGLQAPGVQVFAGQFGIYGQNVGWNGPGFYDRDGNYHVVKYGIIVS